ncbi:CinA family protein [Sphingobium lignivorans]|nr:CinA family protein [Sphingobium lignivorans]
MELLVDRLPGDLERAVRAVLSQACERDLRLATAESCTGGLLAALLTDVEGCSHAFERAFVTYSEEAKTDMLGVDPGLIAETGAVSAAVARAMAIGALERSRADIVLAVTGFAGAAGPEDEPGLVHFACARRGREPVLREAHFGNRGRSAIRLETVRMAISMMRDALD